MEVYGPIRIVGDEQYRQLSADELETDKPIPVLGMSLTYLGLLYISDLNETVERVYLNFNDLDRHHSYVAICRDDHGQEVWLDIRKDGKLRTAEGNPLWIKMTTSDKYLLQLRRATVRDAQKCYQEGQPLRYTSFQSPGDLQIDSSGALLETLTFTGDLVMTWEENRKVFPNWLAGDAAGPYSQVGGSSPYFFYLPVISPHDYLTVLQIASDPPNILSEDALDDIGIWVWK